MKAHVICNNDSIEFVVIGNEKQAEEKAKELSDAYFERNKFMFTNKSDYSINCYWHFHTVNCIDFTSTENQ